MSLLAMIINLFPANIGRVNALYLPCQNNVYSKINYKSLEVQLKILHINTASISGIFTPQVKKLMEKYPNKLKTPNYAEPHNLNIIFKWKLPKHIVNVIKYAHPVPTMKPLTENWTN